MPESELPRKGYYEVTLEPGEHWWCACGGSKKQPFCDGTHKTKVGFEPVMLVLKREKTLRLCGCKRTQHKPYCDDTHKEL